MSLADQFLLILLVVTLVLASMWVGVVLRRRALLHRLTSAENELFYQLAPEWAKTKASRAEMLEKAANDQELSRTSEFKSWSRIANELPAWLRSSEPEYYLSRAELLQLGRGSLLMATLGGATASIGVLLAKSDFQLLSLLGIAVAVLGLQVMYAATSFGAPTATR